MTVLSLAPGDGSCPYGGTSFTSVSGTTYACNGAPGATGIPPSCASGQVPVSLGGGQWSCRLFCQGVRADCDGDPANGCETNTASSVDHCGACGVACPAPTGPDAAATCTNGVCGATCTDGAVDCDGNLMNGCSCD